MLVADPYPCNSPTRQNQPVQDSQRTTLRFHNFGNNSWNEKANEMRDVLILMNMRMSKVLSLVVKLKSFYQP